MKIITSFLILFFLSINAYSGGFIEETQAYIEDYGILKTDDEFSNSTDSTDGKNEKIIQLNINIFSKLKFIEAYKTLNDPNQKPIYKMTKEDAAALTRVIIQKKHINYFEESDASTQELCFINEIEEIDTSFSCKILFENYELMNDELNLQLSDIENVEILSAGASEKNILGLNLEQEIVSLKTARDEDPNDQLRVESDSTPGRNSPLLKGFILSEVNPKDDIKNLNSILCTVENRTSVNIPYELLQIQISILERLYRDSATALLEKKLIYCTLYKYYEENGLEENLFSFLILYSPEGKISCGF